MDALSFLYIALGVGFLLLVIFGCVVLIYVTLILRDVTKITDSVKDTAERINDYVVQPFAIINQIVGNVKPMIDSVLKKKDEVQQTINRAVHKTARRFKKKMQDNSEE